MNPDENRYPWRVTASGSQQAFFDVSLAALCLGFAWAQLHSFLTTHRPSAPLLVLTELLFAVFFLLRRPADRVSNSVWDWVATIGGGFAPLLLRPTGAPKDFLFAQVLQVLGALGSVAGILYLNRSVAVAPAHREVKAGGAYRLVRHPLYAAYGLTNLGYVMSNGTAWNVCVLFAGAFFQIARIYNEERLLSEYPEYQRYMKRTRWRLVPFVF